MIKLYDPIIVVGDNDLTDKIINILDCLGVFIGNRFIEASFEDKEFSEINCSFVSRNITDLQWRLSIERLIIDRKSMYRAWGFKDTNITKLIKPYQPYFIEPKYIWCGNSGFSDEVLREYILNSHHLIIDKLDDNLLINKLMQFIYSDNIKSANDYLEEVTNA